MGLGWDRDTTGAPSSASHAASGFLWDLWHVLYPMSRNDNICLSFYLSPLQMLCPVKTKYKCWIVDAVNNPSYIYLCSLKATCTDLRSQPTQDSPCPNLHVRILPSALHFCVLKRPARKTCFLRNLLSSRSSVYRKRTDISTNRHTGTGCKLSAGRDSLRPTVRVG